MYNNSKEIMLVLIGGTAIVLFLACLLIIYIVIFQKRQNSFIKERETIQTNFERILLQSQLEMQEQTLKEISQEIHDNIGQTLSLAKLQLNTLPTIKEIAIEEKIINSKDLVSKAIQDLRSLSKKLNTDSILAAGILRAIEYELEILEKSNVYKTQFKIIGTPFKLNAKIELILFRIIQEALNNIIKHSGASLIVIDLSFEECLLKVIIEDNGHGFEVGNKNELNTGSGLRNMQNRAQLIGSNFHIESNSRSGTKIYITIPTKDI